MKRNISPTTWNKLQDGIVYLFQYGLITESKHFKLLDELDEKYNVQFHKSIRVQFEAGHWQVFGDQSLRNFITGKEYSRSELTLETANDILVGENGEVNLGDLFFQYPEEYDDIEQSDEDLELCLDYCSKMMDIPKAVQYEDEIFNTERFNQVLNDPKK